MDILHKVLEWLDYNRGAALGTALAAAVVLTALFAPGCLEARTASIRDPAVKVTEAEFLLEAREVKGVLTGQATALEQQIALLEARTELGLADIEEQRAKVEAVVAVLEKISLEAAGGTLSPLALIPIAFGLGGLLFGVGRGYDNKRKDAVIEKLKSPG